MVQELLAADADPEVISYDVTNRKALFSTIEKISEKRPIKGVIHAAMVKGDALFSNATWDQIHGVLAPKVAGTVNLHHATEKLSLDFFVMTSSILGTVGTPSQGAYTAANAFQDAFAKFRHAQSLPATSVGLGLILEVGSRLSFSSSSRERCETPIRHRKMSRCFTKIDPSSKAQMVSGLEPGRFLSYLDSGRVNDLVWYNGTRFQAVRQGISGCAQALSSASANSSARGSSIALRLQNASSPARKLDIARSAVNTRLAELLSIDADDVDSDKPVSRYGVDSLVASELRNWLIKTFGLELSMLQLLNKSTKIEDLVKGAAGIET
ncbi:KR domain-containing protein [Xylaria arbuscula]|nr:KR domain-containing protein [Xylaria arbuscula]